MGDSKQAKSDNSPMSATNFVMYQKMKQSGSRYSERVTMKEEDSYHYALAREYFHLGNEHQKNKQYKLSINFFLTALKYKYDSPEIHNNIGVVYVLNKEYQKAEQSFNRSIQNKLSQIFPKINLANLKLKQDKFTAGIQIFLQLLSVDKDKRIVNHFNKVLASHDNFFRFFKLNFIASHLNIDKHALEEATFYIMEDISKNKSIIAESLHSLQAPALSAQQIQEIQRLFNIIRLKYSSLKQMKNRSELSRTCAHGDELAKCLQGVKSQKVSNIVKLLFMYVFMEERKPDLSLYFYSLIDKIEDKKMVDQYSKLFANYSKIKNIQNMPFYKHYSVTITNQSFNERKQIIESIERFFFRQELPMFQLHKLHNQKYLPKSQVALQIIGKTFEKLQNYQQLSALAFSKYQESSNTSDYRLQAALYQFFVPQSKDLQQARNKLLAAAQNFIKDGDYSTQHEHFQAFECILFTLVASKRFQLAIEVCQSLKSVFPDKQDKIEQYIGSIYLQMCDFQKATEHLRFSYRLNPDNKETNYKLACIYFQRLSARRYNSKTEFLSINQYESFQIQLVNLMSKQYQRSLQYILHAISIDASKIKYYYLLEMLYQYSYYKEEKIRQYLDKLLKENYRPMDFKVRTNIAIFNAMVYQYDKSYDYFKRVLQKGLDKIDANCQDVELLYFIRKCCDTTNLLTLDYGEFGWATELGFYLVIFYRTPELFGKYDEKSHQIDTGYFQYINRHLQRAIRFPDQLINRLERLDYSHKQIIYKYIFTSDNLKKNTIDLLKLYRKAVQIEQLGNYFFSLDIQINLKLYKMKMLQEIFQFVLNYANSEVRMEYLHKSYLVLLSGLIKSQSQQLKQVEKNGTYLRFYTKFTQYSAGGNPQLFFQMKFIDKNRKQLTNKNLKKNVDKAILKINEQYKKYRMLHKNMKLFRANTLYQGLMLLGIEEVLPYIKQDAQQQQILSSSCEEFLLNRNINQFHSKLMRHYYEKEEQYENESVFNPSLGQQRISVLGESKISNLSKNLSSQKPKSKQHAQQYKSEDSLQLPYHLCHSQVENSKAQEEINFCKLVNLDIYDGDYRCKDSEDSYTYRMEEHLRQNGLFQLLREINRRDNMVEKDAYNRLGLFKYIVAFIENCEQINILVTHLHKKCQEQVYCKSTIYFSQLIKIGPDKMEVPYSKRLFQFTRQVVDQIRSIKQKENVLRRSSLSYNQNAFQVLVKDFQIDKYPYFELQDKDLDRSLSQMKKKVRRYHLQMLQDLHNYLFSKYYQSKKLKFYMKLLTSQKISYKKFLGLVQVKLAHN